jgi:hypothetical protein
MIGKVKLFGDSPLDPPRGKLEFFEVCEVFEVGNIFRLKFFSSLRYQTHFIFLGRVDDVFFVSRKARKGAKTQRFFLKHKHKVF